MKNPSITIKPEERNAEVTVNCFLKIISLVFSDNHKATDFSIRKKRIKSIRKK